MSHLCTLGRLTTLWKVHHYSQFSPFVDNGLDNGLMESQSLFFFYFFESKHDVFLFKILYKTSLYLSGLKQEI